MPIYIATRWALCAMAEAVEGNEGISRRIIRGRAENPVKFRRQIEVEYLDRPGNSVDDRVWVGPVSISKDQGATGR